MKVIQLKTNPNIYSGNSYLVLGDWNRLDDLNTLIDTGADSYIAGHISVASTGVGKKPVDQVILTHNHFDHTGGLAAVIKQWNPKVYALTPVSNNCTIVHNGMLLRAGDDILEVIAVAEHSNDSICLWNSTAGILFSGDTPLYVSSHGDYLPGYRAFLERLAHLDIRVIYPGHGSPIREHIQKNILASLAFIGKAIEGKPINERTSEKPRA